MSNGIVLRLRFYAGQTVATLHRWIYAEAADFIEAQAARIAELEAENADLSANQCLHNIHGDEAGNPYCPRIAELEEELSIWRSVFPNKAEAAARIAELEKAVIQSRLLTKLMKPQADRIAQLETALRELDDMIVDLDAGHVELHQVSRLIAAALKGGKDE